jgi:ferric-dicitrate binding protein FerR (iron transport regulator)
MEAKHDLQTLITRKLEGRIIPEELAALETMLATSKEAVQEYKALEKIWRESQHLSIPQGLPANTRWQQLESQIKIPPAKNRMFIWMRYAAAAAVFLVASMTWLITKDEWVTISSKANETISVTLPDSSIVKLSGNTNVSYNVSDWSETRNIRMRGEARFDVSKNGKSFIVESANAHVSVLGTSFNVNSSAERTVVTCFTGKVSVANSDSDASVILTKGLETVVQGNSVSPPYTASVSPEQLVEGLNFNKAPLRTVFESLGKYHDKLIVVPRDIDSVSFTGNLEGTSLESALKTICLSAGLEFTIAGDSVFIEQF